MTDETNPLALPAETKEVWLPALRDPIAKQCTGHLFDGTGHCCLGILAKSKGATFHERMEEGDYDEDADEYAMEPTGDWYPTIDGTDVNHDDLLSQPFAAEQGLNDVHQNLLSCLNDGTGMTYDEGSPQVELMRKLEADGLVAFRPSNDDGTRCYVVPTGAGPGGKLTFEQIADVIEKYL